MAAQARISGDCFCRSTFLPFSSLSSIATLSWFATAPNASKIRYSYVFTADREDLTAFKLPKAITGATKVRLTFTKLTRSELGRNPYRAGVRTFEVSSEVTTSSPGGTHVEPKTTPPGISDYTDIVKILLAYTGWHWPSSAGRFATR